MPLSFSDKKTPRDRQGPQGERAAGGGEGGLFIYIYIERERDVYTYIHMCMYI